MNPTQTAQTVLRLGRTRGLTFRLDTDPTGQPVVRVSPKDRLAQCPWIKLAIPACKEALVHLLATEGLATLTTPAGQPGYIPLARCPTCGASDYGLLTTTTDAHGALEEWGCLTCHADPAQLQRTIKDGLAEARWGGKKVVEIHLPLKDSPLSLPEQLTEAMAQAQADGRFAPPRPEEETTHAGL